MRCYEPTHTVAIFYVLFPILIEPSWCTRIPVIQLAQASDNDTSHILQNLTSRPLELSSNTTATDGYMTGPVSVLKAPLLHCASPLNWEHPHFNGGDCTAAADYLFITEMHSCASSVCEFRLPGGKRTKHIKSQDTPRKYTFSNVPQQQACSTEACSDSTGGANMFGYNRNLHNCDSHSEIFSTG